MESLPSTAPVSPGFRTGQTDYWIKYGREDAPSNFWIQFWTYATPESRFSWRDRMLYPCRGPYPCTREGFEWLFVGGSGGYETVSAPPGGGFLALQTAHADFRGDERAKKLFQDVERIPLRAGRWYHVRLHMDVSGERGVYEAWIREQDASWRKVAEWIGGVTPHFFWPIPFGERVGFLAVPTTANGPTGSTTRMDDFVIATSEEGLSLGSRGR